MDLSAMFRVTMCRGCSTRDAPHLAHEAGGCIEGLLRAGSACACQVEQPDDPFPTHDGVMANRATAVDLDGTCDNYPACKVPGEPHCEDCAAAVDAYNAALGYAPTPPLAPAEDEA